MERLTYRGENGKPYVRADGYYQHCRMNLDIVAERLAAYEDAEEQGLLVRLPCKVGDTVWVIITSYVCGELGDLPETRHYIENRLFKLSILENFGKTVFLTREEAEAALKGD